MTTTTQSHIERIKLHAVSPELYDAMMALSNAASKDIDPDLAELIKIRASQLNHCAFCLNMHSRDARNRGITEQTLALLTAWSEAGEVFTDRERAALALTEEITKLTGRGHVSDAVYSSAAAVVFRARARSGNPQWQSPSTPGTALASPPGYGHRAADRPERSNSMHTAYLIITLMAAALVGFSAWALMTHAGFIMEPLVRLQVPRSWWPWLAAAKAAGALGLVAGLFVPVIGILAATCLVLYFIGAVITTLRVRWYGHISVPLVYVAPVIAVLILGVAAGWPHWTVGA